MANSTQQFIPVNGPASAVDSRVAVFDGTTGVLIKDGGQTIAQISAAVQVSATIPATNNFRLTLASGSPVYNPQNATPNGRASNVASFAAAHGWVNGTICTTATTGSGLTAGTQYYIHVVSSTSVSFHTSVAGANDGSTNIVTLSGTPNQINVSGVENTTLYATPYYGNAIALYDGVSAWNVRSSAEFSVALGTLTTTLPHDVFCYDNSGTPTLELLAWTSDTARATALTLQDGVPVKTGATTRRYIGTFRTNSTTTTIDDAGGIITVVGAKRFVWNAYNRVNLNMRVYDTATNQAYTSGTIRQLNGTAGNKVEFVLGMSEDSVRANSSIFAALGVSTADVASGIGLDTTTAYTGVKTTWGTSTNTIPDYSPVGFVDIIPVIGYHYLSLNQNGAGGGTSAWYGGTGTGITAVTRA